MNDIGYIIPHYGRDSLLLWHLRELNKQTFKNFEVIVVVDDGPEYDLKINPEDFNFKLRVEFLGRKGGPAATRNYGASLTDAPVIMFAGSDCIPHENLIMVHQWRHSTSRHKIVQGYTPWHPGCVTDVTKFIESAGLQANWNALKNNADDDNWTWVNESSPSFCLTTNYSIDHTLFNNMGGFDESFPGAAWEDIEFGIRMAKFDNLKMLFAPNAINFHYHNYDVYSFLRRCRMEGRHRIRISRINPEMSFQMMSPDTLRASRDINESEIIKKALTAVHEDDPDFSAVQTRIQIFVECCRLMSAKGIIDFVDSGDASEIMKLYEHARSSHDSISIVTGDSAIDTGHYSFAFHCAQWLIVGNGDQWYPYAFSGEVSYSSNDFVTARDNFKTAMVLNPSSEYIARRLLETETQIEGEL